MDKDLKELIAQFKAERLKQGLSSRTITNNDGNGVYHMEKEMSEPKIGTFQRWCDKLGLKIKLVKK